MDKRVLVSFGGGPLVIVDEQEQEHATVPSVLSVLFCYVLPILLGLLEEDCWNQIHYLSDICEQARNAATVAVRKGSYHIYGTKTKLVRIIWLAYNCRCRFVYLHWFCICIRLYVMLLKYIEIHLTSNIFCNDHF